MLEFLQEIQNSENSYSGKDFTKEQVGLYPIKDLKMLKNLENKAYKCLEERFGSTLKFFPRISKKYEFLAGFKVDPNHSSRCV